MDADTFHRPNGSVKAYLTNHQANIEDERCMEKLRTELGRDVIFVYAKDSAKDIGTATISVGISNNRINKMGNVLDNLKWCIGARAVLTLISILN